MKSLHDYGIIIPPGRSGQVRTTCPKCSSARKKHNDQCLSVNTETGEWYCHHCHWNSRDEENTEGFHRKEYSKPTYEYTEPGEDFLYYLNEERGISEAVLIRNQIGEGEAYFRQVDEVRPAITFPYFRDDQVVNIKYLAHEDGKKIMRLEGGAERIPYGLNDLIGAKTAIWVEGEIDKLSVETAGFMNCVSVPNGAPDPKTKHFSTYFSWLETCADRLDPIETHIIAVDNDPPGCTLERELSRRLGPEKCKLVEWPAGCKDANDVLREYGPEVLAQCIKDAKEYPVAGIYTVEDISPRINALYQRGFDPGCSTGWKNVDALYRPRAGEWTVVTGVPNCGKSEWVDALLVNLAQQYDWSFGYYSPENLPLERHFAKLAEKYTGKLFSDIDGAIKGQKTMTLEELEKAKHFIGQHFFFILPEENENPTLESILEKAKVLVARKGIQGLVIDPWNSLDHTNMFNLNETQYTAHQLSAVTRFVKTYGIHMWIVAHPTKPRKIGKNGGDYAETDLYDISGSANWYNKTFYGITIHREKNKDRIKLAVRKVKFKEVGRLGEAWLDYDVASGRFTTCFKEDKTPPYTGSALEKMQPGEDDGIPF